MGNRAIATNGNSSVFPHQTWVKQLAGSTMLNISPFGRSGTGAWLGPGATNFAYGGATTQYTAGLGYGDATGNNLSVQISNRYLNPVWNTGGVQTGALHTLYIGSNDLNFAAAANPAAMALSNAYLNNFAVQAVLSAETQIQALATAGVTDFLWLNLPNMALIPVVSESVGGNAILLSRFTSASQAFNAEMDAAILRLELANPTLDIIKFDTYGFLNDLTAHPGDYGFTNVTGGANNDNYFFSSDKLHPTSHGHAVLAGAVYDTLAVPEPRASVLMALGIMIVVWSKGPADRRRARASIK